jgi:hypothetical protein
MNPNRPVGVAPVVAVKGIGETGWARAIHYERSDARPTGGRLRGSPRRTVTVASYQLTMSGSVDHFSGMTQNAFHGASRTP